MKSDDEIKRLKNKMKSIKKESELTKKTIGSIS